MKNDLKRFAAICRLQKPHLPAYIVASLCLSARNFFILSLSASLGAAAVAAAAAGDLSLLWGGAKRFAIALAAFVAVDTASGYWQALTLQKMSNRLREKVFGKVLRSSLLLNHPLAQRGEMLARINQDVETVMGMFASSLVTPVMYLVSGVGATVTVLGQDPWLCVLLYAVALGLLAAQTWLGARSRRVATVVRGHVSGALEVLLSGFVHAESVREQRLQGSVGRLFSRQMGRFSAQSGRAGRLAGALGLTAGVSAVLSGVGVLFFELLRPSAVQLPLGDIVYIAQMAPLILTMVMSLGSAVNQLQSVLVGVDRVMELLELTDEQQQDKDKKTFSFCQTEEVLSAHALCCTLGGQRVLQGLDAVFPQNSITAILGESGVGKTTFLRLVEGLYPYDGGSLRLCGQELATLTRQSVRQAVTYVAQDAPLLEGPLRQSLTMGLEGTRSDEALWQALAAAGADGWFARPVGDGLTDFQIEEGAGNLSGGQRQCVVLARAFLADTPLYIFDEVFAGMDRGRIARVMANVRQKLAGRCVLIVTHDPQVAALCDGRVTFRRGE